MRTRFHGSGTRDVRRAGPARPEVRAARGAILVQVALMLVGLTAFSAFIVDYGVLWTARRQVQNAADAAALAAAISLAFDAPGDQARARANAQTAVAENPVWGAPASMTADDITFAPCPTGSVGTGTCVRVEAFRDRANGNELPTIFASLVGVDHQGVRATATAQVLYGNTSDCVRPIAIPDRWIEQRNNQGPPGWDPLDTFENARGGGAPDFYIWPGDPGENGTGYSRTAVPGNPGDFGREVRFAPQLALNLPVGGERFVPVRVTPGASGPADFEHDLATCPATVVQPLDRLFVELADTSVPTRQAVNTILAEDPTATWDAGMNGGRGGVSGGCMSSGTCTVSPRIIPIAAFDPQHWDARSQGSPSGYVVVTRVLGLFLERLEEPYFVARMMGYPAPPRSSMTADPASAFVLSVALVR